MTPDEDLELLVQGEMEGALRDAQITSAQAPIKAPDALLSEDLYDAVKTVLVPALLDGSLLNSGVVQLKAGLDQPDRVGSRPGSNARKCRGANMYYRSIISQIELLGDDPLPIAVCIKLDRTGRDDARESGTETSEEAAPALDSGDRREDVDGLPEMVQRGSNKSKGSSGRMAKERLRGELRAVVVGL